MTTLLLDRYRPLEKTISGGYGSVTIAWDERMHRRVAIKSLPLETERGQVIGLEEARTAALLNHPNIVSVLDFEVTEDAAYIIMEYVDGITLSDLVADDISLDVVAAVAKAVGSALAYAHKNGVLHLDVKPANILINHEGHIKLADFGVALLSHRDGHSAALGGTVGYMPREQLNSINATQKTDQWAFGAVIYEMLTEEFPYEEEAREIESQATRRHPVSPFEAMRLAQDEGDPELLETTIPDLNYVLTRTLSIDSADRYPTVRDCRDALLAHLGDPAIGVRELKEIVADYIADDDPELHHQSLNENDEANFNAIAMWRYIGRAVIGLMVGVILYRTLGLEPLIAGGIDAMLSAVVGILLVVVPVLGTALCLLIAAFALLVAGQWIAGLIALIIGGVWWYFCTRHSTPVALIGLALGGIALELNVLSTHFVSTTLQLFGNNLAIINGTLGTLFILVSVWGLIRTLREGPTNRSIER